PPAPPSEPWLVSPWPAVVVAPAPSVLLEPVESLVDTVLAPPAPKLEDVVPPAALVVVALLTLALLVGPPVATPVVLTELVVVAPLVAASSGGLGSEPTLPSASLPQPARTKARRAARSRLIRRF